MLLTMSFELDPYFNRLEAPSWVIRDLTPERYQEFTAAAAELGGYAIEVTKADDWRRYDPRPTPEGYIPVAIQNLNGQPCNLSPLMAKVGYKPNL